MTHMSKVHINNRTKHKIPSAKQKTEILYKEMKNKGMRKMMSEKAKQKMIDRELARNNEKAIENLSYFLGTGRKPSWFNKTFRPWRYERSE